MTGTGPPNVPFAPFRAASGLPTAGGPGDRFRCGVFVGYCKTGTNRTWNRLLSCLQAASLTVCIDGESCESGAPVAREAE